MKIDELFTESRIDATDAISKNPEIIPNVPLLKDVHDYDVSIRHSSFSKIIRLHYGSYQQLGKYIHQVINIIENCFAPESYKDIIVYDYTMFSDDPLSAFPMIQFKINPSRIKPERMLRFLASISTSYKNSTDIDVLYFNDSLITTTLMTNECLIAKYIYTLDGYFFTAKDCEDLSKLFKILGFFSDMTEGDAYCAISDIHNKLVKLEYGQFHR